MPEIVEIKSKTILTKQTSGFLTSKPYPFTHSLSAYTGCGFGQGTGMNHTSSCGSYCYAKTLPNWINRAAQGQKWGNFVMVKSNAAELLYNELSKMKSRQHVRIFMSPATDPFQPIESKYRITHELLQVFKQFDDLDLLVIQTRSPLVLREIDIIKKIPYVFVSVTLETDRQEVVTKLGGGVGIQSRINTIKQLAIEKIKTQITVSPCLMHSNNFYDILISTGANRFVIDDFLQGDGSGGQRTAQSEFAKTVDYNWQNSSPAKTLYNKLTENGFETGWSNEGFCGIKPRNYKPVQENIL